DDLDGAMDLGGRHLCIFARSGVLDYESESQGASDMFGRGIARAALWVGAGLLMVGADCKHNDIVLPDVPSAASPTPAPTGAADANRAPQAVFVTHPEVSAS